MAVLALAAGLADEAAVALRLAADGLAVGDLRPADVRRDLELADHAVDDDVEVQLAHAGDEGLAALRIRLDPEGGVLLGQALEGDAHLVLVGLRLGLDLDLDDGLGERDGLEQDRVLRIGQGVAGEGVLEADDGRDVARVDLVDLLAVVGVHLRGSRADALLLALGRVEHVRAGLERARVDPEEGELADERVGRDLEGEGREGLLVVDRPEELAVRARAEPDGRRDVERRGQVLGDGVEHRLDALVLQGGAGQDGHELRLEGAEAEAVADLVRRQLLALEVLVGERVVRLGRPLRSSARGASRPRPGVPRGSRRRRSCCRGRRGRGSPSSRSRSTTPSKVSSDPIGIWIGTGRAPRRSTIISTQRQKSAPVRSSLLMKQIRGTE